MLHPPGPPENVAISYPDMRSKKPGHHPIQHVYQSLGRLARIETLKINVQGRPRVSHKSLLCQVSSSRLRALHTAWSTPVPWQWPATGSPSTPERRHWREGRRGLGRLGEPGWTAGWCGSGGQATSCLCVLAKTWARDKQGQAHS